MKTTFFTTFLASIVLLVLVTVGGTTRADNTTEKCNEGYYACVAACNPQESSCQPACMAGRTQCFISGGYAHSDVPDLP